MTHRALITAAVAACVLLALFPAGGRAQAVLEAPGTVTLGGSSTSLTVVWTAPASDGGSAITAYDLRYTADDNSMVEEDIWSSGALQYELTGLQRDTSYKVEVRAVNANGDGTWSDPTSGATTDHGDSRSSASLIALDSSLSGRIDESDTDWFSFTVTGTEDIWIYSASDAPTDLVGELFNAVGDSITRSSNSYRFENTRDFSLRSRLQTGTYYVQVTSSRAPAATHTRPYVFHARRGVTPGTSFDTAATIETGVSAAAYFVDPQYEHFFTFTVERATDVWLLSEGSIDTVAELRDSNRQPLADNDDGFLDGIERGFLISATLQPGEYYIYVTSFGFIDTGPYVLRFLTGDNPGNTPQTAATVPLHGIATGNIASSSDRDYFRLTMDAPTEVRLRVLARGLRSINLAVFDDNGIDVTGDFQSTSDPVQVVGFMNTGTYYVRITSGASGRQRYLLRVETTDEQKLLDECAVSTHPYADPLYGCQWHLSNTGQFDGADQDINVEAAWGTTLGSGVNVAVVDEAMRTTHPDLRDNIVTARNHNFFSPPHADDEEEELFHATAVAGLIGARDNELGVRGVAPRASLHSIDLLGGNASDFQEGQAMALHLRETHISNNSWGPPDTGVPQPTHSAWFSAIERGVLTGAEGKGISYVWAAGNGGPRGDDANLDEYANHYGVTAVCAVNIDDTRSVWSETGANLWVCAPSDNDSDQRGLMTTAPSGYEPDFGGTSGAAPVVSGVIALMRAANPELTWRDVKLILAATARKNDSTNSGWEDGALQYGSSTERYSFNHEYGFGVVDAGAAVARALTWPDTDTLPAFREITGSSTAAPLLIPDLPDGGTSTTITSTLEVDNYVDFVEFLEINIDLTHTSMRDLDIDLVSPSGVTSRLARKGQGYVFFFLFYIPSSSPIDGNHRFGSARHLGENAAGTWTLRVTDRATGNSGTLKSWSVTAYGHGHTPDPPVIQNGTSAATSVTVVWTAPTDIGGSAVTSYDLRYIRADAADKSGLNWTPVNAIWTSGELSYELTGLDRGRSYDLQVRAVNASGAGPWSPPMTGATLAIAPESPAIESIQPRNGKLIVEWSVPGFDGGAPISRYDVRHVLSENLSDPDPPWTILSSVGARIAPGEYRYTVGGLENDASHAVQVRAANRAGAGEWSNAATGTPDAENTNPAFLEGETASRSLREDVAVGTDVGAALLAVDADSDPLEYTVSGEIGPFSFDPATAQLRVAEALDYETATTYTIGVQVQDGQDDSGNSDTAVDATIEVTITVEDLDEGFEISGAAFITLEENTTGVLETYTATDPEGKDLTWSRGGTDADDFTIAEGALSFAMTPDYEAPLDSDEDNLYSLDVSASDGFNVSTVAVTVAVGDKNELPIVTGPSEPTIEENSDGEIATYTATDPEGRPLTWDVLQYSHHGPDYGEFDLVFDQGSDEGARLRLQRVPDFESPTDADRNNVYEVILYSNDREGAFWQWKRFDVQVTVTNVNEPPVVVSGPTALTRPENGDVFLGAYEARDPDAGDTASWDDLEGDDANHFRQDASGRLSFRTPPDFEARANNVYQVIVVASDDGTPPLIGSLAVTVTVTPVDEPPVIDGEAAHTIEENSLERVGRYTKADPEGRATSWLSLMGADGGHFELDEFGELSFAEPPDFEARADSGRDNVYNVIVRASDDGTPPLIGELAVTVTLTDFDEPPEIDGEASVVDYPENSPTTRVVGSYRAADPEGAGVTWSDLSGNDAGKFEFSNTGVLTFKVSPNFEQQPEYEVMLNAFDGGFTGSLTVTVTIADVNEPPTISGEVLVDFTENGTGTVEMYSAMDPDVGATQDWSLAGADGGDFEITNGVLTFINPPDYDMPTDDSRPYNEYLVTVQVNDGANTATRPVTVRVLDVNEAPTVSGNATPSVDENTTAVATYRATDPDERATITWSVEDPGASDFTITNAGALSFASAPNYEVKSSYTVTVRASDGTNDVPHDVTVTVTDVDEREVLGLSHRTPLIGEEFTAAFEEGTGDNVDNVQPPTWAWARSTSKTTGFTTISGAAVATYLPAGDDRERYLRVTVSYNDGHGQGRKTLSATSEFATAATRASNTPPTFPSPLFTGGVTGLSVPENAGARTVVGVAPEATDMQGGALRYFLAVDGFTIGPPFGINPTSRQIRVASGAALDHEDEDSYSVMVTVVDEFDATATATFDITIEDVNEPPVAVADPAVTTEEDTPVTFDVLGNDTDPDDGDTLTVMTITTQPGRGSVVLDTNTQMLTYTPAKDDHDTYTFMYTARDDDPVRRLTSPAAQVTVTVNPVNDAPEFETEMTTRTVSESAQPGDEVGTKVEATDVDDITLTYSLSGASDFVIDATGQIRVAPGVTLDREGTSSYEVTVTASDRLNESDSITVTINVSDVPEPPTAVNDTAMTAEDTRVNIDVLDNDTDPDTERARLRVSVLTQPLNGTARAQSDQTITYTPNANFAGPNSFTYRVSDGRLTDDGSVSVTVVAVNDAPTFFPTTAARSVPEDAEADDNVGAPVTATDVDGDLLGYRLSGPDASSFDIDSDGQITVAERAALDAAHSPYSVTVTADDRRGETAMVEVTITVTAGPVLPPVIIITGGGGGGGGGGGPSPSEVDFEWNVKRDIEQLDGGNDRATGVWSDGTTLWVADNADGAGDAVYAYNRASGERLTEREFALHETNRAPRGFWSDRSVVWVSDSGQERLFAYDLATGERLEEREFALAERNADARGIWSDEKTMWVLDGRADALFAYDFESGELLAEYELDAANDDPRGIWSDGVTIWVADHGAKRLIAYRLPVLPDAETDLGEEDADDDARELERVRDEEFTELSKASNNSPRGIWSDGDVMYVADESDDRVYSYNMPDAIDARLASLTLSGVDIGEFDPGRTDYEAVVADGVTETTVEAGAAQDDAVVDIAPADADGEADGHQVALQDLGEITVTVTSQDGSRTKTYRVELAEAGPSASCLRGAVSVGFSLVVSEGGSLDDLVACAGSRHVTALYVLDGGEYVSYIVGAPELVNARFVELFPDGVPALTPLIARSDGPATAAPVASVVTGPWPWCLQGEIVEGFNLVLYEGGSIDDLDACAEGVGLSALYVLDDGVWVSYILGAPELVNHSFRELFTDVLPVATPLVGKSH